MKMKLTILAFGLLLAVGWTNVAQAQLKRGVTGNDANAPQAAVMPEQDFAVTQDGKPWSSSLRKKAPRRGHSDVRANEVNYTKAQYSTISYDWYEGTTTNATHHTASLTDTVTDAYQMYWMLRDAYINTAVPGILWNDVFQEPTIYFGLQRGWNIGTPQPVVITLSDSYSCIRAIQVLDTLGNTVTSWTAGSSSANLPSTWTASGTLRSSSDMNSSYTYYYISGGGTITIPASALTSSQTENYSIKITAGCDRSSTSSGSSSISFTSGIYGSTTIELTNDQSGYVYTRFLPRNWGTIDPPAKNSYTVFLIKLKDFPEVSQSAGWDERTIQRTPEDLINVFTKYFQSIELLTDGLRVGENDTTSGTVFAYTGVLNRFYFIGKGKTASYDSEGSGFSAINYGPFYTMYEEFSPTTTAVGDQTLDFYTDMHGGAYYPVKHDCATVLGYQHYFSMYGKDTTVYKSVSPMVLYIPDLRSKDGSRNYEEGHQPQVGLYTIDLSAESEPVADYSDPDNRNYIVYLDWTSSLNQMVNNTVDQTYIIYTVTYDTNNKPIYTPLDTVYNVTTYDYIVPQQQTSQQIEYVIMGYPTNATNNPEVQQGGIFFTYSNPDDVQIPGWFDFMILYRERYESDFVIKEEKNYYRNYLYPTNLAPGTGMTMEQLKKEWPNQTASYTLWRDNLGIAKLEVRAIGDKVYYRIRYYKDTQVTTGPNANGNLDDKESGNAKMPFNYVEIPNE